MKVVSDVLHLSYFDKFGLRVTVEAGHSGTEVVLVREGPRAGGASHSGKRVLTISRLL